MTTERIDCRWRSMPPVPPSGAAAPTRLRNRPGAMVALLGLFMTAIFVLAGLTLDFARLGDLKSDLQQSADAGAHAAMQYLVSRPGGIVLFTDTIPARVIAQNYAQANLAMEGTVTVDFAQVGNCSPSPGECAGFTAPVHETLVDGVYVEVSRQSSGMIFVILGLSQPRLRARAYATSAAPFFRGPPSTNCLGGRGAPLCPVLAK